MNSKLGEWISMLLSIPVLFYFGKSFFVNAYRQILIKKANMDALVALSTGSAFLFSVFNTFYSYFFYISTHVYYESAVVIISFILLGKLVEEKAKYNSFSSLRNLIGLQPKIVKLLLSDNQTKEVSIDQIQKNDILVIHP
jgi:P-type Cu2+ transporter